VTARVLAVVETHAGLPGAVHRLLEEHLPVKTASDLQEAGRRMEPGNAGGVVVTVGAIDAAAEQLARVVYDRGDVALLIRGGGTLEVWTGASSPSRLWAKRWDEETLRPIIGRGSPTSRIASLAEQALAQSIDRATDAGSSLGLLSGMLDPVSPTAPGGKVAMNALLDAVGAALLPLGSPELFWYAEGVVFCAVPGVSRSALVDAAWRAQRTFIRRQLRDGGAASAQPRFAVTVSPTDAAGAGPLVRCALEVLGRCRELDRQVIEVVPALLLAGSHGSLRRIGDLLERIDIRCLECTEDEVVSKVSELRPAAVLMNVLGSRSALSKLGALLKLKPYRHIQVVLATPKEASPQALARAAEVPNAVVVAGKERFKVRTLEALAVAVGVKQRRHLRHTERIAVAVVRAGEAPVKASLLNLSESGALLLTAGAYAKGARFSIGFSLPEGPVVARARVVWCRAVEGEWALEVQTGVEFEGLPGDLQHLIGRFVAAQREPERRVKIKVRLRGHGSNVANYLQMTDLSESGFRRWLPASNRRSRWARWPRRCCLGGAAR
jgi:hypothetical protein